MLTELQKLENLFDLAEVLCEQNDYDEILRLVAQKTTALFNAESASIMMINPLTRQTIKTIQREGSGEAPGKSPGVQTHVSGWVINNKQPFASEDLKTDSRFAKNLFEKSSVQTALAVPLRSEGVVLGTLVILEPAKTDEALEQALSRLKRLAAIVSPFLRNAQQLQQYFNAPLPENALLAKFQEQGMLGKSKKFVELLQAIESAARCEVRVMLQGQSGAGKELIARAIHRNSARADKPFVAIDCGAIAVNLIESELFGHVKGAFTGANADRKGLMEEANGGTLFMDEIANLPLDMQAKLMRVLQEGEVRPVGGNKTRQVDVRIISASSASLRQLAEAQKFREDLFYRLHVYPIYVPSLNERHEDIPLLANHFLKKYGTQQGKSIESLHEEILDFMQQRRWPGNIRELENFVERLVALTPPDRKIIDRKVLPDDLLQELKKFEANYALPSAVKPLNETLEAYEAQVIRQALIANNWNQSQTARQLKIAEQTLRYKMGKLGIERPNA
jgi:transcriptional regulator with GAF, ATPase, and Fis domain